MWSSVLAVLTPAYAGACCGATGAIPARLDSCDDVLVGLDVAAETAAARWTSAGDLAPASPSEQGLSAQVLAGVRWLGDGQLLVSVPLRYTRRTAGTLEESAAGPGDVRAQARWTLPATATGWPLPTLVAGLRSPTGTSWDEAEKPLLSDATGEPGASVQAGLAWTGSRGETPWTIEADGEIPLGPAVPRVAVTAGVGRFLGSDWTGFAVLSRVDGLGNAPSDRTSAGLRLVRGERGRWRGWMGVASDLPAPRLGRANPVTVSMSLGAAWVR